MTKMTLYIERERACRGLCGKHEYLMRQGLFLIIYLWPTWLTTFWHSSAAICGPFQNYNCETLLNPEQTRLKHGLSSDEQFTKPGEDEGKSGLSALIRNKISWGCHGQFFMVNLDS